VQVELFSVIATRATAALDSLDGYCFMLSARLSLSNLADLPPVCSLVVSRSVVLLHIRPKSAIHGAASGALWGNLVMTGFGAPLEAVLVEALRHLQMQVRLLSNETERRKGSSWINKSVMSSR
jgi:hypothetical protein